MVGNLRTGAAMTAYMDHKDLANEVIDQARAQEITDGVHRVLDQIAAAESAAGRAAGSVQLLAATKTRDVGEILAAIDAGIRVIGENRPQEITVKADGLAKRLGERGYSLGVIDAAEADTANAAAATHIPFHIIGQLQANKISKVLPVVDTIVPPCAASRLACCWKSMNPARNPSQVVRPVMPSIWPNASVRWADCACRD